MEINSIEKVIKKVCKRGFDLCGYGFSKKENCFRNHNSIIKIEINKNNISLYLLTNGRLEKVREANFKNDFYNEADFFNSFFKKAFVDFIYSK